MLQNLIRRARRGFRRLALLPRPADPLRPLAGLRKAFGDLHVRPKLVLLHNAFFLVLAVTVYAALIPRYERRVAAAEARETALVERAFSAGDMQPLATYGLRRGSAVDLGLNPGLREWLDQHPAEVRLSGERLYRKTSAANSYATVVLPSAAYRDELRRARWLLALLLAAIYAAAVAILEFAILPLYVYRPLRLMLDADLAAQRGASGREIIPEELIPGDEIGRIMRSRNATIAQLRKHERDLADALQRIENAKHDLAAQDRLASLGLLSASVAHELNSPLAVLRGSVEKLLETVPDTPAQERLQRMQRVTNRLRRVSETLLDFARPRPGCFEPVRLRSVVDEAWELLAFEAKAGAVRYTNAVHPEHLVSGDPDRLVQVFVNLLRNALFAVDSFGTILVQSRVFFSGGAAWVEITVEDNGPGIPAEVLPQMFEAFVTTRLDARGTGLGLAVAEGIVEQHGGSIAASNREGGGARLAVTLPAALTPGEPTRDRDELQS